MLYWKNSAFQTVAFIVGKCFTADEAYRKVTLQLEERERAIVKNQSAKKRAMAKLKKAEHVLNSEAEEWDRLEAEADIEEIQSDLEYTQKLEKATQDEVAFLRSVLQHLDKFRNFKDLSDSEAFQKVQRIEFLYKFIRKAEASIALTGNVTPDAFEAMRAHPDFEEKILPTIQSMMEARKDRKPVQLTMPSPAFKEQLLICTKDLD